MDRKLHETTKLCVELMNSKLRGNLVTWYKFDVHVMLSLN